MAMKQNNFYLRWQKAAGAAKSEQRSRSIRTAAPGVAVVAAALADPKVQKFTEGKKLVKTILVPNKLVNLIAK